MSMSQQMMVPFVADINTYIQKATPKSTLLVN